MGIARSQRDSYNGVPTKNRQDQIRALIDDAIGYSLEMYSVKQMALDMKCTDEEAEWASKYIGVYAKIEKKPYD